MLSSVLRSERAVRVNIEIMLRQMMKPPERGARRIGFQELEP